jgi:hypothetical protein
MSKAEANCRVFAQPRQEKSNAPVDPGIYVMESRLTYWWVKKGNGGYPEAG